MHLPAVFMKYSSLSEADLIRENLVYKNIPIIGSFPKTVNRCIPLPAETLYTTDNKQRGRMAMTVKAEILRQLKHDILTLALKPGSRLGETALSERFRISRTPLRDVLKQLEREGYLDVYPKRGNLVSYIDLESVEQIIYLRVTLERDILRNLASRTRPLPPAGVLELRGILERQERIVRSGQDREDFLHWDDAFHQALFALEGREFLWDLIRQANVHYARYRRLHLLERSKMETLLGEHRLIFDSVVNRDAARIDELVQRHLHEDVNAAYLREHFAAYLKLPPLGEPQQPL